MTYFKPGSTQHLSCILFGGTVTIEAVEPIFDIDGNPVLFKSGLKKGELKTHKVERKKEIKGFGIKPLKEWKNKTGFYSTKKEVLQYLALEAENEEAKNFVNLFILIRKKEKQLSTYYESVLELLYKEDGCVHPSFNHCATDTGRLSCNKPNVQNQPETDHIVKYHFVSRFYEGLIIEADYKGIEPRVEAQLSNDPKKIQDVLNGVDDHTKNLALKEKMDYKEVSKLVENDLNWSKKRKAIKGLTFTWQYGGGDAKAAKNSGLTLEEVKEVKEFRKLEYPTLHKYYQWLKDTVEKCGQYKDPWGRIYKFRKFPATFEWQLNQGIRESYSPTQIQNYRTQGFATATLVTSAVGVFWRLKGIFNRHKYLMINTVHDSLILDCRKEFLEDSKKDLKLLEDIVTISEREFNYFFKLPLSIDIKQGKTWGNCK